MKYDRIEGIDKDISKLVMGCDNQDDINEASKLWDHWIEVGGNIFDTAFIYGGGNHEKVFGEWLKNNNRQDVLILGKGAHSPECNPEAISKQLTISLERMKTDYVDIYIMHRDNTDYPIDEFMDVLNQEKEKGRIKIFGGSNWTIQRFKEANEWAEKNNKQEMSILNNNLALAKMIKPLWNGCLSSNTEEILAYLNSSQKSHMSWSSQARGYFLPDNITQEIEDKITKAETYRAPGENSSGPISCYDSEDNRERKKRAMELAEKKGCSAHNIAASWTINQSFPSFALIGPRTIDELDTTLPCLDIELTKEEINWLNDLYGSYEPAITLEQYGMNESKHYSHSPGNKLKLDRKLDYLWTNTSWSSGTTHQSATTLSDHIPITAIWEVE